MPIEKPKEPKKSLVLESKGGSLQGLQYVMSRASPGVIQEAKNDMLFAALQGENSLKSRSKIDKILVLKEKCDDA